jgi:hypothetical protein
MCFPFGLELAYARSEVVFMGVLVSVQEIEIFMPDRFPGFVSVFNFEVLEIGKGISERQTWISVLDNAPNTTCGTLFSDITLEDTVLVFAQLERLGESISRFVTSNSCLTYLVANDLARHDSAAVVRALPLKKIPPSSGWGREYRPLNQAAAPVENNTHWLWSGLLISIVVNLWLACMAWWKQC